MIEHFSEVFGPWAIVTGASSGIGREFCRQLADLDINLVLVSRNEAELERASTEIKSKRKVQTRVVPLDLSEPDFLPKMLEATEDLDIGLVVSNAGADHMGALLRIPLEDLRTMQRLNAASHLDIAHGYGSRFLKRRRKTAGLLFLSSTASLQTTPLLANYAAAKAYVLNLGGALHHELKGTGIRSSVLVPGLTTTPGLTERTDVDFKTMPMKPMDVEPVVRAGLNGLQKNQAIVIPGKLNRFMDWAGRRVFTRRMNALMWGMLLRRATADNLKM